MYGFTSVPRNADYVATTSDGTTYFYDIPKMQLRVKYQDVAFENVGHPRLLFAISTNTEGKVESVKLGAIKGKQPLTMDTSIWHYPYSNVHSDGRVCWSGYHNLPIDQIPNIFLSTANNGHLNNQTLN